MLDPLIAQAAALPPAQLGLLCLAAGLLLGAGLVLLLRPDRRPELAAAQALAARLEEDFARDRATIAAYRQQETAQAAEIAGLKERTRGLEAQLAARAEERAAQARQQAEQFELLARRMLDQASAQLAEQSGARLDPIVAPLKERLQAFQKKVEETYQAEARERFSLKNEIEKALATTDTLSRALRGQAQLRGQMGETLLERVLQAAGLQAELHYVTQGRGMALEDEAGRRQKPDAIVHLPDGKSIVIDSKVALNDFATYVATEDASVRAAALSGFIAALRRHVTDLAGKSYQDNPGLKAPDFVLLYMPFEHALAVAIEHDPDLFAFAWAKRVAIVGPNTLVVTMRVVERIWRQDTQERNAQVIIAEATRLHDQVAMAAGALEEVGSALAKAADRHDNAMKRLFTGNNNVARQAERLRKLGVQSARAMPPAVLALDDALPAAAAAGSAGPAPGPARAAAQPQV